MSRAQRIAPGPMLALSGALLWIAACAPGVDDAAEAALEVSSRELRAEVQEWFDGFRAAQERGDAAEIASYYALDSRFRWFEEGTLRYSSPGEIEASLQQLAGMGEVSTSYDDLEILITGPSSALMHTRFRTTIGGGDGGESFAFAGVITASLLRTPGLPSADGEGTAAPSWKFLIGHSSTERPQQSAAGAD